MSISITSLAECALAALLGLACSKAPAQGSEPRPSEGTAITTARSKAAATRSAAAGPAPTPEPASSTSRSIEIRSFDCHKVEHAPEAGAKPADHTLLGRWAAGGPAGASWNASGLTCFASVYAECAEGELQTWLSVGSHRAALSAKAITQQGLQAIEFAVPEHAWRRGLDPDRKPRLPYRTALFVLRVEGVCRAPTAFGPGDFPYREVADVRAFVAGFASGE